MTTTLTDDDIRALRTAADMQGLSAEFAELERRALSAPAAPEPVALWQYRWTNPGGNIDAAPEDTAWKEVQVTNVHMQTMEDRLKELRAYRYNDRPMYEVRALYAGATPTAPSVPALPREREAGWFSLVMNAAAAIEDAAHCLRDPDAKRAAGGAAKHYRKAAQTMWGAFAARPAAWRAYK